ncbi:aminotransferase class I/II-fold pyridoxal phosphate-dependent enzyme [Hyphomonas johnsonii]|uniref:GDP-perosamine synthase n=1 Tax=Hyphomonas johnsonii MHS-2 TaxID=1280950 RepID=A0A059FVD6_9PROT|nr:aminotransferase class I/II-fold pyridoxal phosphate-dependent enzyme [Hyphomonas johnsonii]KCZ94542.1 DegT/DnrJ/EryC1/StrS aminotransferase [Hyphomonas johnsonii MHS-2]
MIEANESRPANADPAIAAMTCGQGDAVWVGIERALDNGQGFVFVTDAEGVLTGFASLTAMRASLMQGGHLGQLTLSDVAEPWGTSSVTLGAAPVLDDKGRLVGIDHSGPQPFLPVSEPDLTHREMRFAFDAFLSTWISSTGDYIRRFEQDFADKVGMAHGVATSNGTVSLHLALATLGIGEGDEVIVPDLTFAASINTVMHVGARPVIVDVDPDSWCMTAESIARAITPRTRAIMPVHVFGRPSEMTEIVELARSHGLYVIEDAAEAHGAQYDGKQVGSFSDISSFSFFANKIITTGEGGICLTNDADLAGRMRMLRDHGMRPERRYWHEEPGFNFRMTNMQAAIGCAQIERMDELLAMRANVHAMYEKAMAGIPGVAFPPAMSQRAQPVTWFSCAQVPADKRDALIAACRDANIDLRPFFNGLSAMPAYRRFARHCPNSNGLSKTGVNLPTSRRVDQGTVDRIAQIFENVLGPKT